jgi:cysteine synthase A
MLRLARPEVHIIVCEPEAAALLAGKPFSPHKIQGWTPDFVPSVLNRAVPERLVTVSDAEAIATARALATKEGIFCGISAGGTFAAALSIAREVSHGAVGRHQRWLGSRTLKARPQSALQRGDSGQRQCPSTP